MSSSTSAKSSGQKAELANEADKTADSKAADGEAAAVTQATSGKDKSALNGASREAGEKPYRGASASTQADAAAEEEESADGEQGAGPDGEAAGDTAKAADAAEGDDAAKPADLSKDTKLTGTPESDKTTKEAALQRKEEESAAESKLIDDLQAKTSTTAPAAEDANQAEADPQMSEPADDEEEDTLDLRALFASSEPDFASPTDTFEMARGAKSLNQGRKSTTTAVHEDADSDDGEPPLDLPPLDVTVSEGQAFMARGSRDGSASSDGETSAKSESFGADPGGDPLADAVQSALRSVYGEDGSANDDFRRDSDTHESEGPVLQWAGAGAASQTVGDDPYRPDENADANVFTGPQRQSAIDEETTEAVLSYLYEHMDSDTAAQPGIQDGSEQDLDDRPDHVRGDDGRGHEQWLDSAMPSRTVDSGRLDAGNYDGHRADRGATPAYAYAEQSDPGNLPAPPADSADFATPMDLSLDSSEASGKLLGAAGLGLIGGIAVAGVAAVFVFNSFVTQQDPSASTPRTQARLSDSAQSTSAPSAMATVSTSAQKDESRLAPPEEAGDTGRSPTSTVALATPDSAPAASGEPSAPQAASPATSEPASEPQLDAGDVAGQADQAIPLQLALANISEDSFVRIVGLPDGVRLSAGVDTGNGSWLLSSNRASNLSLSVPQSYEGNFMLEAQVLDSDARTPISNRVVFQVSVSGAPAAQSTEVRSTALDPETARAVVEQPPSIIERARSLMSSGDVLAAREALRPEAEGGNAKAALALGQTFDPMTFNPDSPANAGPDATEAFRWYQKAVELGAPEGEKRMADLKSWLLQ